MKQYQRGLVAVALAFNAYASVHASEVLNIPASAAIERHADQQDQCDIELGVSILAEAPTPASCYLDFPIMIPANRTIDQIAVYYGSSNLVPNPSIEAWLATQSVAVPYNNVWSFDWQSSAVVLNGTIASGKLMPQAGGKYLAQFLVRTDTMYHVLVHLYNGAWIAGVQVTYE